MFSQHKAVTFRDLWLQHISITSIPLRERESDTSVCRIDHINTKGRLFNVPYQTFGECSTSRSYCVLTGPNSLDIIQIAQERWIDLAMICAVRVISTYLKIAIVVFGLCEFLTSSQLKSSKTFNGGSEQVRYNNTVCTNSCPCLMMYNPAVANRLP